MKTNDLKKGQRVLLLNGWEAELWDNKKGNTRVANVFGDFEEAGSIYAHDIVAWMTALGDWNHNIEYTPAQIKLRAEVNLMQNPY